MPILSNPEQRPIRRRARRGWLLLLLPFLLLGPLALSACGEPFYLRFQHYPYGFRAGGGLTIATGPQGLRETNWYRINYSGSRIHEHGWSLHVRHWYYSLWWHVPAGRYEDL